MPLLSSVRCQPNDNHGGGVSFLMLLQEEKFLGVGLLTVPKEARPHHYHCASWRRASKETFVQLLIDCNLEMTDRRSV